MLLSRYQWFALGLVTHLNPCSADPALCLGHDPIDATKEFFATYYNFYATNPDDIAKILAPRLLKDLQAEYKCAQGKICAIEADPWTDAQDGAISEPITFSSRRISATNAEIVIHYLLKLSEDGDAGASQFVVVNLEQQGINTCWTVADLVSPSGESLVGVIEKWLVGK